jgi:hypothetical protein
MRQRRYDWMRQRRYDRMRQRRSHASRRRQSHRMVNWERSVVHRSRRDGMYRRRVLGEGCVRLEKRQREGGGNGQKTGHEFELHF